MHCFGFNKNLYVTLVKKTYELKEIKFLPFQVNIDLMTCGV